MLQLLRYRLVFFRHTLSKQQLRTYIYMYFDHMHEIKTNDTSLLKISDKIRTSLPQLPPNLSIYQLYVWVGSTWKIISFCSSIQYRLWQHNNFSLKAELPLSQIHSNLFIFLFMTNQMKKSYSLEFVFEKTKMYGLCIECGRFVNGNRLVFIFRE